MFTDKLHNLLKQRKPIESLKFRKMRLMSSSECIDENGRFIKNSNFADYNVSEQLKNLKVDDFSIQSLRAVGADLKPVTLPVDNHSFVSDITRKVAELISTNTVKNTES